MRFVVTGTPGSGTRYVSQLLTRAGVDTDHERSMPGPSNLGEFQLFRSEGHGEVTWAAAPWLHVFKMPTVHLIRDPLRTISTLVSMKFTESTHREALDRMLPGVFDLSWGPEREAYFWLRWTTICESAGERWHVEDIKAEQIERLLKRAQIPPNEWRAADALAETAPVGHRTEEYLAWADLGMMEAAVRRKATEYGYWRDGADST